jgi:hypothetical protein
MVAQGRTLRDGFAVGFIGYASVALFYAAFDQLAARGPFYTVDLLGKAVFRGLRDPGVLLFPFEADVAAIVWYNALHLLIALLIGFVVTSLVAWADQNPSWRTRVRLVIVAGFVVTIAAVGVLTAPMRPVLPWWSIVVANVGATLLAGWYLVTQRPGLWRRLVLVTN